MLHSLFSPSFAQKVLLFRSFILSLQFFHSILHPRLLFSRLLLLSFSFRFLSSSFFRFFLLHLPSSRFFLLLRFRDHARILVRRRRDFLLALVALRLRPGHVLRPVRARGFARRRLRRNRRRPRGRRTSRPRGRGSWGRIRHLHVLLLLLFLFLLLFALFFNLSQRFFHPSLYRGFHFLDEFFLFLLHSLLDDPFQYHSPRYLFLFFHPRPRRRRRPNSTTTSRTVSITEKKNNHNQTHQPRVHEQRFHQELKSENRKTHHLVVKLPRHQSQRVNTLQRWNTSGEYGLEIKYQNSVDIFLQWFFSKKHLRKDRFFLFCFETVETKKGSALDLIISAVVEEQQLLFLPSSRFSSTEQTAENEPFEVYSLII